VQGDRLTSGNPLTFVVAANAFNHACATESPQGVAALIKAPKWSLDALLQVANPVLLVLAALQDPGNVGTIIRSAEAFGVTGILLTPGTVHPWNQKVLRASAGSSFRLPVIPLQEDASLEQLRTKGIPLYAASAQAKVSVVDATLKPPVAFVIGNEGAGISTNILASCSGAIHIPYSGPVESLNAAVAASILLYEVSRQSVRAAARSGI
jgi:TrmH family RNA methyltransferase